MENASLSPTGRRVVIITDAWKPQTNGVVRTLSATIEQLRAFGYEVDVIEPNQFRSFKIPFYKEIPWSYGMGNFLKEYNNLDKEVAFYIATEGPLGAKAKKLLRRRKIPYTTSFCTMFPSILKKYLGLPEFIGWHFMRRFHKGANNVLVSSDTLKKLLKNNGFKGKIEIWGRGVDIAHFRKVDPHPKIPEAKTTTKVALYVGRVCYEKNIESFLECSGDYVKYVVGDGPARLELERKYPDAKFLGYLYGDELVSAYSAADVFVFPSKVDTFGLVIIEALACGLPVAAYPITGPIDIITVNGVGCLDEDLQHAIEVALVEGDASVCRKLAEEYSWEKCTRNFLQHLEFVNI